jgi:hypothetical protein
MNISYSNDDIKKDEGEGEYELYFVVWESKEWILNELSIFISLVRKVIFIYIIRINTTNDMLYTVRKTE